MGNFEIDELVGSLKDYLKNFKERIYAKRYDEISNMLDEMAICRLPQNNVAQTGYERMEQLFNEGNNEKLTFVLGAGVSADFGIPNWENLIFRINFSNYWENMFCGQRKSQAEDRQKDKFILENSINRDDIFNLFRSQNNLYEWAQYAENSFCSDIEMRNRGVYVSSESTERELDNKIYYVVKESLYFKLNKRNKEGECLSERISNNMNVYGEKSIDFCTISFIYKIAKERKCDRIITYNYDDCLEYVFEKGCEENGYSCVPIFDKEQLPFVYEDEQCKIYHVHGFIPYFSGYKEGGDLYKNISKEINSADGKKLILTEVSYDDMSDEIYKWRNSVQVETLLSYHCIFVGFSATDVNFKRIVKQLSKRKSYKNEKPTAHFIAVCLDDYIRSIKNEEYQFKSIELFINALKTKDAKNDILYQQVAMMLNMINDRKNYLERYNIYPIFTTIKDLPKLLAKLANIPYAE